MWFVDDAVTPSEGAIEAKSAHCAQLSTLALTKTLFFKDFTSRPKASRRIYCGGAKHNSSPFRQNKLNVCSNASPYLDFVDAFLPLGPVSVWIRGARVWA